MGGGGGGGGGGKKKGGGGGGGGGGAGENKMEGWISVSIHKSIASTPLPFLRGG